MNYIDVARMMKQAGLFGDTMLGRGINAVFGNNTFVGRAFGASPEQRAERQRMATEYDAQQPAQPAQQQQLQTPVDQLKATAPNWKPQTWTDPWTGATTTNRWIGENLYSKRDSFIKPMDLPTNQQTQKAQEQIRQRNPFPAKWGLPNTKQQSVGSKPQAGSNNAYTANINASKGPSITPKSS